MTTPTTTSTTTSATPVTMPAIAASSQPLPPATFVVCKGLPGCGKSTKALAWVAAGRYRLRLNRDSLRIALHGTARYSDQPLLELPADEEDIVRSAYYGALQAALLRGWSVVDDNTNLNPRATEDLIRRARSCNAQVEVWDLTDVPIETCIARDAARPDPVGRDVIEMLHQQARRWGTIP